MIPVTSAFGSSLRSQRPHLSRSPSARLRVLLMASLIQSSRPMKTLWSSSNRQSYSVHSLLRRAANRPRAGSGKVRLFSATVATRLPSRSPTVRRHSPQWGVSLRRSMGEMLGWCSRSGWDSTHSQNSSHRVQAGEVPRFDLGTHGAEHSPNVDGPFDPLSVIQPEVQSIGVWEHRFAGTLPRMLRTTRRW